MCFPPSCSPPDPCCWFIGAEERAPLFPPLVIHTTGDYAIATPLAARVPLLATAVPAPASGEEQQPPPSHRTYLVGDSACSYQVGLWRHRVLGEGTGGGTRLFGLDVCLILWSCDVDRYR